MIDLFVVDASVAVGWVHPSQATGLSTHLLDEIESGARFLVPSLWFLEIANALLVLQRRKRLNENERRAALSRLRLLNPVVEAIPDRRVFVEISSVAFDFGLSVYDAVYLDLAKRRSLPFATQDTASERAASKAGVKTISSSLPPFKG